MDTPIPSIPSSSFLTIGKNLFSPPIRTPLTQSPPILTPLTQSPPIRTPLTHTEEITTYDIIKEWVNMLIDLLRTYALEELHYPEFGKWVEINVGGAR